MRWFAIVLVVSLAAVASAQVPRVLSYQGILTDRDGRILPDGEYRLTIRLYDRLDATEPIYVEEQRVAAVRGVVNALIGTVEPLPARLTFDRVYYVGISVDGSEELRPRTMLTAVPYALRSESAAVADVARALAPEALKGVTVQTRPTGPAGGDLTGTYPYPLIGQGKVTTAKIAGGAVTTEKIADRNVTGAKIHQMGATNGQVLTWVAGTVNNWKPTDPSGWAWMLSGNAISGGEFLGTTNNKPLVIRTNNTERLRVTSGGNVGIGTTSPAATLDVVGTATISSNASVGGNLNVAGNTTLGDAAADQVVVNAGVVQLVNIPGGSTSTDVLVRTSTGSIEYRPASGLIGGNFWSLTGNGGTDPNTNFLGTTDAQPLVIRVDNQETFRFNAPGTSAPGWSIQRGGGNTRGFHAVDLQSARSAATQVASGNYSVISGGYQNTAIGIASTVGGGVGNIASGGTSTVGGGVGNNVSGTHSTIGGGNGNAVSGDYSTVGGGHLNSVSNGYGTVAGGLQNTASGYISTVGGGRQNIASNNLSTVGGGRENTASGPVSTVGGGFGNTARGYASTVGGGQQDTASGDYSTVGGGRENTAIGDYSAIPGGSYLRVGHRSFGFSGQTSTTQTNLSSASNIAAFVDVDLWLYNVRNQASQLRLYEPSSAGTNFTAFQAQAQAADITYRLPASLTPVTTVAAGLLQTDASGNLSWVSPSSLVVANAWSLTGNSGTNPATHFLGTTDNQPIVIRTNNTEWVRVTSTGQVGIGTTTPTATLEVRTAASSSAVSVVNTGGGPGIVIDNSGPSTPGRALEVANGGGGVKFSYGTVNVVSNAATIPGHYTAVVVNSDNNTTNDNITLPTSAVDGQVLYVRYVRTGGRNNAVFIGVGADGGNYTTVGNAHLTFVYMAGAWRLMSVRE